MAGPAETRPADGLAIDFVVESVPALNPAERRKGKTVIRVRP